MALDYLMIPATSVEVERVFSRGRNLLSYVRNRLSAQSTRAVLCLGYWSKLGLVKDRDILRVASLLEVPLEEGDSDSEVDVPDDWEDLENE
ncbi:hypothetical protein H0H93_009803 [Arthromyces matolae]|nr:hypothetical protein H0H93_009803 [Arthromyces matolae]